MAMTNADRHEGDGWQGSFDPMRQLFGTDDGESIGEEFRRDYWPDMLPGTPQRNGPTCVARVEQSRRAFR